MAIVIREEIFHLSYRSLADQMGALRGLGADLRLGKWKNGTLRPWKQPIPSLNDEIVVAMSSGVDSSVAALMMANSFPNVRGVFMANWASDRVIGGNAKCTLDEDWGQVQETCAQIGIPCSRVSFEKEYWNSVFAPMLEEYDQGYTPNPDIGCNKYVKFGSMVNHLRNHFGEGGRPWWLVTGHYARIMQRNDGTETTDLFRACFRPKDQSYYLTGMAKNVLPHVLMPMGHYTKPEIREIAHDYGLVTRDKPDSQGLCFVSQEGKFKDFLSEYLPPRPGNIVDREGNVWGKHGGLWEATIGQRSGVSMPQGDPRYKGVWFVCDKNVERNELVIARKDNRGEFYKTRVEVDLQTWYWMAQDVNWDMVYQMSNLNSQIRSLQEPNKVVHLQQEGNTLCVQVSEEIFGIAPGQTLALYDGDRFIGSGRICGSKM